MSASKTIQYPSNAPIRLAIATCIHHEVFDARLGPSAAQRAIEQNRAARRKELARFFFYRDWKRAGFNDNLMGARRFGELHSGIQQSLGRGQRGHDDVASLGHF